MKQTAVEWLVEQLKTMDTKSFNRLIQIEMSRENFEECFEQAKEMEEEQSIKFGKIVADKWGMIPIPLENIKDTYNETFESE